MLPVQGPHFEAPRVGDDSGVLTHRDVLNYQYWAVPHGTVYHTHLPGAWPLRKCPSEDFGDLAVGPLGGTECPSRPHSALEAGRTGAETGPGDLRPGLERRLCQSPPGTQDK